MANVFVASLSAKFPVTMVFDVLRLGFVHHESGHGFTNPILTRFNTLKRQAHLSDHTYSTISSTSEHPAGVLMTFDL